MFLLALLPFIIFLVLLLWLRRTLLFTSLITLLIAWIIVFLFWQIRTEYAVYSLIKGFFVAFDIFLIVAGALFFLRLVQNIGIIDNLSFYLKQVSRDYRIQVILLVWFLGAFLEGTSGFGTPGAIIVPLLVGIGLSPFQAVVVGLLGDNTPGAFGAVGTPLKVGFASFFEPSIAINTAAFSLVGLFVPMIILYVVTGLRGRSRTDFLPAIPFALFSGASLVIPSFLSVFIGQEFPSIIGPLAGLIPVLFFLSKGWLIPKQIVTFTANIKPVKIIPLFKTVFPYLLLIALLVIGKITIGSIGLTLNFGLSHRFNLYNPGLIFMATAIIIYFTYHPKEKLTKAFGDGVNKAVLPFLTIVLTSSMVQLMVNSGMNNSGLPSMINTLSAPLKTVILPLLAPFIGAFGSMITGSITVSNLMFGEVVRTAAIFVGLSSPAILALLTVGAASGDTIALADILAAEAVVGIKNREREVVLKLLPLCLIILLLLGIAGLLFV